MSSEGTITIVPSVHFSPTHRRRTREVIHAVGPDLVAIELDERRFERLTRAGHTADELWRTMPPGAAIAYGTLQTIQQTVLRLYGLDPGKTEMETAIETAAELELDVALIDEPIGETLTELTRRLGPETIPKLLLRSSTMPPAERLAQLQATTIPLRDVEHGDDVQPMVDAMRRLLPEVTDVLIDRRDRAMARRLHTLRHEGYDVVAIVGAGHHNGIRDELEALEGTADGLAVPIEPPTREVVRIPIE
ncbi:TraB domain-containing protein [Natronobeatus ordinarius]|uniref:TraB domain-containing protein n=1 Tax=Natronobeatus ordinarius TaxID=2963433 RepID=UPI0020CCDF49|nr:TraB domain-containing protein [Natronobeatus ordinarius]